MDGLFVIQSVGVNIFDHCLKIFDFDQDGKQHDEGFIFLLLILLTYNDLITNVVYQSMSCIQIYTFVP